MKLFVTGGTGFIGSHFINQAHSAGHEIVALRRSQSSLPRIALEQQPRWLNAGFATLRPQDFANCDAVVHLAAHSTSYPHDTLENCLYWNVIAPLAMFRSAADRGIDRFVIAGSCFEYGLSGERYEYIPVDAPLLPMDSYSASKASASIAFAQFAIELQLRLSIHRIFHVFGKGEAATRLWPSLTKAAIDGADFPMTLGAQVRDFSPVEKVASKLLDSAVRDDVQPGAPIIENIGSGIPRTLRDFAEEWWFRLEATGELQFGALPERPHEVLRFVPQLPT